MNFARRSEAAELMDTHCTDAADYAACLHDLARVNTLTLARRPTLAFLRRALRRTTPGRPLRVFDVAYGEGDMLRAIARRFGPAVTLGGIDMNPDAARVAARTAALADATLLTGDVLACTPEPAPDLIISSLFTHHLTDAQIVEFLRWMERHARRGWFINDLNRHWLPWAVFRAVAWLLRMHRFVQHDGGVSIARSFRSHEWHALLREAGVPGEVRRIFPFRLCVSRLR